MLVEALYSLANDLEDVLVSELISLVENLGQRLILTVRQQDFYRQLYRLLGNDGGMENQLNELQETILGKLQSEARTECDRYVRESPSFYNEGTFSIYQFRQTLLQTSQGYDASPIIDAEPAIRQLLKLDFEPKINKTIRQNFRQTINQTIKTHLLPTAEKMADNILQKYDLAKANLEQTLQQEAEEKIAYNQKQLSQVEEDIKLYNEALKGINSCLQAMQIYDYKLPLIAVEQLEVYPPISSEVSQDNTPFSVE